ncbi:hypothetical protein [uncultured Winogradskyella sp.]|uniref:hypothetical protein n=1 Tax=uncultured Winogradskyella sp. TaxID=395353 RepID=UPI0026034711|nr:hypothetical protein [uncultured Winogradskyella sp.]
MTKYNNDRSFTDYVHDELAIPKIYNPLGWDVLDIDDDELEAKDINEGIDYVLINSDTGEIFNVQERFRDNYYKSYNDATLRYRREFNTNPERIKSEFYKIKADYLVYGITDGSKWPEKRHTLTDFIKWVILDVKFIQSKFEDGKIKIVSSARNTCWLEEDILCCPENFNPDGSSSFLPFDIPLIFNLWGKEPIFAQNGFITI